MLPTSQTTLYISENSAAKAARLLVLDGRAHSFDIRHRTIANRDGSADHAFVVSLFDKRGQRITAAGAAL